MSVDEIDRIRHRLGILSNHFNAAAPAQHHPTQSLHPTHMSAAPTQPFTATIHPIPYHPTSAPVSHFYHPAAPLFAQQHLPQQINQTFQSPSANAAPPPQTEQKELETSSSNEAPAQPAKTDVADFPETFLSDQRERREQHARMEQLARIQRRRECNDDGKDECKSDVTCDAD